MTYESDFRNEELIRNMRDWRVTHGHGIKYANERTALPLVTYVCHDGDHRFNLMFGTRQADLLDTINAYLGEGGHVLCMLAVFLWIMTIIAEIHAALLFTLSFWLIKKDSSLNHCEDGCTKDTNS